MSKGAWDEVGHGSLRDLLEQWDRAGTVNKDRLQVIDKTLKEVLEAVRIVGLHGQMKEVAALQGRVCRLLQCRTL